MVTTPDRAQGRGLRVRQSAVAEWASERGLGPLLKPERLDTVGLAAELSDLGAELFVVIAYRILPERIFTIPPLGTLNVHASLLPRYRGPAPIQRAIENGEEQTGVTVFRIDTGVDTGGVLVQRSTPIGSSETALELYGRLSRLGAEALLEAVAGLAGGALRPVQQDSSRACRAPKLRKEEGLIDWSLPAEAIARKVRAFQPFPGTCTVYGGKRLGVMDAEAEGEAHGAAQPGAVVGVGADAVLVATGAGVLRVSVVKPEGKAEMNAASFARGARLTEGTVLG